jgi:hypothetical protein
MIHTLEDRSMQVRQRWLLVATVLLSTAAVWACGGDDSTAPETSPEVEALRTSLAPYASLSRAHDAGYSVALTDCMSNGDIGAMGVHFGNGALIDAHVDVLHPEVLIYEPGASGAMSLVGVEFIIPFTALPRTATPPVLFGREFTADDAFGLWALHVWTHRTNPSGTFSPWNPRVHCS